MCTLCTLTEPDIRRCNFSPHAPAARPMASRGCLCTSAALTIMTVPASSKFAPRAKHSNPPLVKVLFVHALSADPAYLIMLPACLTQFCSKRRQSREKGMSRLWWPRLVAAHDTTGLAEFPRQGGGGGGGGGGYSYQQPASKPADCLPPNLSKWGLHKTAIDWAPQELTSSVSQT